MDKLMLDHFATFPYFHDPDYVNACKENEDFRALLATMVGDLRGTEIPPILLSILCGPSRHKRFTFEQVAVLQAEFDADDSLRARGRADSIAARTGLTKKQVTSTSLWVFMYDPLTHALFALHQHLCRLVFWQTQGTAQRLGAADGGSPSTNGCRCCRCCRRS
jgi:hypothetical protein